MMLHNTNKSEFIIFHTFLKAGSRQVQPQVKIPASASSLSYDRSSSCRRKGEFGMFDLLHLQRPKGPKGPKGPELNAVRDVA